MQGTKKKGTREKQLKKTTRVGIVVSDYYNDLTGRLLEAAQAEIEKWGVSSKNIVVAHVAGSFEIPYGSLHLLEKGHVDGVVTLGCLIKGETAHDEYIASAVSQAIMELIMKYKKPVSFGVITALRPEQAEARSLGKENKGKESAVAVLESLALRQGL